jgi:hypothetical protein
MNNMKLNFTSELPKELGFYWWTNFGEHTPCVVEVTREGGTLYAEGHEYSFRVSKPKIDKDPEMMVNGHYYGEEMWCRIPNPRLEGKEVKPNSY